MKYKNEINIKVDEKLDQLFEKYGDTLSPNFETEDKIWNVVNSKLGPEVSSSNNQNLSLKQMFIMKKFMKLTLAVFVVCFVIAVPIGLTKNTGALPSLVGSLSTGTNDGKNKISTTGSSTLSQVESTYDTQKVPYAPNETVDNTTPDKDRAKLMNAYLVYKVADVWSASDRVYKIVTELESYTTDVNVNTNGASFTIKVPVDKFASMHQKLREIASSITEETINSVDQQNTVSEWKTSIKGYEDQLVTLNDKLAKATSDSEKANLRAEIASVTSLKTAAETTLAGVLKTTDVSTISLVLQKDGSSNGFNLNDSLRETLSRIQDVVVVWINIVLIALVAIIAVSPVTALIVYIDKRSKAKKQGVK